MTFIEYQNDSRRTCPTIGHVSLWTKFKHLFVKDDNFHTSLDIAHMVLGINSEINELQDALTVRDDVNLSEEIADVHWYISNLCRFRGYDYDTMSSTFSQVYNRIGYNTASLVLIMYREVSLLQDVVKKDIAYGKQVKGEVEHLSKLCWALQMLADRKNISIYSKQYLSLHIFSLKIPINYRPFHHFQLSYLLYL